MASVPKSIPKEPGAARCGDTYNEIITVRGTIPGTDFGGEWSHRIEPVMLPGKYGGETSTPPEYTSDAEVEEAADRIDERLVNVLDKLELEDYAFNRDQRDALKVLALRGLANTNGARKEDLYQAALPGQTSKGSPKKAQQRLVEALQHLRCAEYWTWRVFLHWQALQEYEPPLSITAAPQVSQPVFPVGPDALPEPPPDPGADDKKTSTPRKGVTPWLIAGGLGLAGIVWYVTRKK